VFFMHEKINGSPIFISNGSTWPGHSLWYNCQVQRTANKTLTHFLCSKVHLMENQSYKSWMETIAFQSYLNIVPLLWNWSETCFKLHQIADQTCTEGRRQLLKTTCFCPSYMHVNTSEMLCFLEGQFGNNLCLKGHMQLTWQNFHPN
jgi:hypothetical protein